eukprot:4172310-Prymnesium_polylepis.2
MMLVFESKGTDRTQKSRHGVARSRAGAGRQHAAGRSAAVDTDDEAALGRLRAHWLDEVQVDLRCSTRGAGSTVQRAA